MFILRSLRVAVVGFILMTPRIAEGQGGAPTDQIAGLVAEYDRGWNIQDTVTVARLLASRYQYFTSRGDLRSRAEMLRFLGSPEYALKQAKRSELMVTLSGPVAVVSSRWQGHGTYEGKPFNDDQRCGLVWLQRARTWQLLSEHCVQIAPKAP